MRSLRSFAANKKPPSPGRIIEPQKNAENTKMKMEYESRNSPLRAACNASAFSFFAPFAFLRGK